jgi:hypothetical protein
MWRERKSNFSMIRLNFIDSVKLVNQAMEIESRITLDLNLLFIWIPSFSSLFSPNCVTVQSFILEEVASWDQKQQFSSLFQWDYARIQFWFFINWSSVVVVIIFTWLSWFQFEARHPWIVSSIPPSAPSPPYSLFSLIFLIRDGMKYVLSPLIVACGLVITCRQARGPRALIISIGGEPTILLHC